nr:nucleotide-binding, alpha-beta plait [Tanacetum cinerariifolium]
MPVVRLTNTDTMSSSSNGNPDVQTSPSSNWFASSKYAKKIQSATLVLRSYPLLITSPLLPSSETTKRRNISMAVISAFTTVDKTAHNSCKFAFTLSLMNYGYWKTMIEPFLVTNNLMGYVDGSVSCPSKILSITDGTTSRDLWLSFKKTYAPHSTSMEYTLKTQLLRIEMHGDETPDAYLNRAQEYANALAAVGEPIKDNDLVMLTVSGLREEYNGLKTTITARQSLTAFSELHALLSDHDYMLGKTCAPAPSITSSFAANYAVGSPSMLEARQAQLSELIAQLNTRANSHVTPDLKAMDNSEAYYDDDAIHVCNAPPIMDIVVLISLPSVFILLDMFVLMNHNFLSISLKQLPHPLRKHLHITPQNHLMFPTTDHPSPSSPCSPISSPSSVSHLSPTSQTSPESSIGQPSPVSTTSIPTPPPPTPPPPPPITQQHPANLHKNPRQRVPYNPSVNYATVLPTTIKPTSFTIANNSLEWRQAMKEEYDALMKNRTWSLVPRASNTNVVDGKWVYRLKRNKNGVITCYKARFVAKGFWQQPVFDFHETFSPVVKSTTIQAVLSLAVTNNWPLRQLDVHNAFLHGNIKERVYMQQPSGFIDPQRSNHKYILELLQSVGLSNCNPVSSPMVTSSSLSLDGIIAFFNPAKYRQLVGSLQYVTLYRPDIAFAVNKVWDSGDRRSTRKFAIYLGLNFISWTARKQRMVSRSSTEPEYKDIADTVAELTWLQALLHELGIRSSSPTSFTIANNSLEWRQAMKEEYDALMKNKTWSLVPRASNTNVVDGKWVYRLKRNKNGVITCYKARFVAKGFWQQPVFDFHETFSPVVKSTTIQAVLSLAVINNWPLRQLDVHNAFLHGNIKERVYMQQP